MQEASLPRAKKRFGQNFLVQPQVVQRIIAAIAPQTDDLVVEIGPGPGALTRGLLQGLSRLDVVELDRDLLAGLRALDGSGALRVHHADALSFDFAALASGREQVLRVVGNLPYNIATPLIFHLLDQADVLRDMHFMLQKEVVERMVAAPGSKAYGRLSAMIQASCAVVSLCTVAPDNFFPAPKVDSAFLRLIPHRPPRVPEALRPAFAQVVAKAFAQRRKTIANNLRGIISADTLLALDIDPGCRAETLDQAAFLRLAEAFLHQGSLP